MRRVRWSSILSLVLLPSLVFGDVIYLKNGRSISADSTREDGGKVEYQRGEATYGIPAGLVDHIDHSLNAVSGPQPVGTASARMTSDTPGLALSETVPGVDASADVIRDGRVNPEAMAALERGGNSQQLGSAYFAAGRNEYEHGDRDRARYYLQRAAAQLPQSTAILNNYAAVLAQLGKAPEAISVAQRSLRIAPSDAEGYYVLGFALYQAGRAPEAIQVWKQGLGLRPDRNVEALLARAERETTAESDFQQSETGHFQLRYEGASTPAPLRREIEQTLEQEYSQLEAELGIAPQNTISVSLYSDKAFFDVTQAPSWTGALNDGKLRIPIQGLKQVTPALARILKHELAHSFINQASQGRCPQWLNEGIAQLVEPRTLGARGARLAQLYSAHGEVPLQQLQSSFMDYSSDEARLVYDQALAAAEYIRQTYGPGELSLLLERIGEEGSVNSALQSTLHTDYGHLDDEIGRYLISRYGR